MSMVHCGTTPGVHHQISMSIAVSMDMGEGGRVEESQLSSYVADQELSATSSNVSGLPVFGVRPLRPQQADAGSWVAEARRRRCHPREAYKTRNHLQATQEPRFTRSPTKVELVATRLEKMQAGDERLQLVVANLARRQPP